MVAGKFPPQDPHFQIFHGMKDISHRWFGNSG